MVLWRNITVINISQWKASFRYFLSLTESDFLVTTALMATFMLFQMVTSRESLRADCTLKVLLFCEKQNCYLNNHPMLQNKTFRPTSLQKKLFAIAIIKTTHRESSIRHDLNKHALLNLNLNVENLVTTRKI